MELLFYLIDVVLHLDKYLTILVAQFGPWIYAILFFIIFGETGFVVMPFLPGDSLLFVAGAVAAIGGMDITLLILLLTIAAILGNSLNYLIGRKFGVRIEQWNSRFFNRSALEKTRAFYVRHGGKTIVVSRFLPLLRTFAPFVAGIGHMNYARFTFFTAVGGILWVSSLCLAGYFFGNIPLIRNNLPIVILGVIAISFLPLLIGWWRHRKEA